jgi:hypothetical protein
MSALSVPSGSNVARDSDHATLEPPSDWMMVPVMPRAALGGVQFHRRDPGALGSERVDHGPSDA